MMHVRGLAFWTRPHSKPRSPWPVAFLAPRRLTLNQDCTKDQLAAMLRIDEFPLSSKYDPEWVFENEMVVRRREAI